MPALTIDKDREIGVGVEVGDRCDRPTPASPLLTNGHDKTGAPRLYGRH
jgi:hypothetical protein